MCKSKKETKEIALKVFITLIIRLKYNLDGINLTTPIDEMQHIVPQLELHVIFYLLLKVK